MHGQSFQAQAAHAASVAGVVPNQYVQSAASAAGSGAAVAGGKVYATYPPSYHAMRFAYAKHAPDNLTCIFNYSLFHIFLF